MTDNFKGWLETLRNVSGVFVPEPSPTVPTTAQLDTLEAAFGGAVLRLYNNSLRVCGIVVGDGLSESNSRLIDNRLGAELRSDIMKNLADSLRLRVARLEEDEAAMKDELCRIDAARKAAETAVLAHTDARVRKLQQMSDVAQQIRKLMEQL